jgi:hypothetical protein
MSASTRSITPWLGYSSRAWFISFAIAQLAFAGFILTFFTPRLWSGDYLALNDKPHITGYVPGDTMGNAQLLHHVYFGAVVTLLGGLQFLASIRRRWPAVHRWIGRSFMATALIATLSGFYLTWVRGSQLNAPSTWSISMNGALILGFVVLAWRTACQRDFAAHRRHATRAFLLVNGVLFLRIGLMFAGLVLAPLGIKVDYSGWVFIGVSFLSWLGPLLMYELVLAAERSANRVVRHGVSATLALLAFATLAGAVAAILFMWWPRL